jgi:hypothetical protein
VRELASTDALVVLGGDGTFLRAVRAVAEVDVPILGINLGKVGFLSKAEAGELDGVLAKITEGKFTIDERMALEGRILRDGEPIDIATIDVSFISLDLVLGPVAATLAPRGSIVALVKPQFEAGRGRTDHGVVRDPAIHREVLERTVESARRHGLGTRALIASPITGPEGNREFLVHLGAGPSCAEIGDLIAAVTEPTTPEANA